MSKIQRSKVKNLKALSEFEATFNGVTAIITGANNSGKSSFLRSLPDRFRGIKPNIILKTGEKEGFQEIELTSGERLIWNFNNQTAKGEVLIYERPDEAGKMIRTTATKELMERMFPGSFDIDVFLNSTPAKQRKMLQDVVGLDFTELDNRYKLAYDERTLANKKRDDAKAKLEPIDEKLETVEKPLDEIKQKLWAIDAHNEKFDKAEKGRADFVKQKGDNEGIIKSLQAQIKKLENENKDIDKRVVVADAWLAADDNKKKDDDYHFKVSTELQEATDLNKKIVANNQAIKQKEDLLQLDLDAKAKDRAVKDIENQKTEMIRTANMPEGFDFSDDGITYNGLPVSREQLSSSSIYIAALKLASMTIGEVRTLHFDASFLDKNSLAEIEAWAVEQDLQLLIELPDRDAGVIRFEILEEIK